MEVLTNFFFKVMKKLIINKHPFFSVIKLKKAGKKQYLAIYLFITIEKKNSAVNKNIVGDFLNDVKT